MEQPDLTIPTYFANKVAELGTSSLSHSLDFLSKLLMDSESLNKSDTENLGNLLAVLSDYAHLVDFVNNQ